MLSSRQKVVTGGTRFSLFQDGHDMTVSIFRCFHEESPARILRENSTFRSYYFLGGITLLIINVTQILVIIK